MPKENSFFFGISKMQPIFEQSSKIQLFCKYVSFPHERCRKQMKVLQYDLWSYSTWRMMIGVTLSNAITSIFLLVKLPVNVVRLVTSCISCWTGLSVCPSAGTAASLPVVSSGRSAVGTISQSLFESYTIIDRKGKLPPNINFFSKIVIFFC